MSNRRKIFLFALVLSLLVGYGYYTDIDNRIIQPNEVDSIRGTLSMPTYIDGPKSRKVLNIELIEYPNTVFTLSHTYFSSTEFRHEISTAKKADKASLVILRTSVEDITKNTTGSLPWYNLHGYSSVPVYGFTLNNKCHLTIEKRNEIWKSNHRIGMIGSTVFIIVILLVFALELLNVFDRLAIWFRKSTAFR